MKHGKRDFSGNSAPYKLKLDHNASEALTLTKHGMRTWLKNAWSNGC